MDIFQLTKAMEIKFPFKVQKEGRATRYTLASSEEQCSKKYKGWTVVEISWDEYLSNYNN